MAENVSGPVPVPSADLVEDWGDPKKLHHSEEAKNLGNSIKSADVLPVEVYGIRPYTIIPDSAPLRGVAALHAFRS